MPEQKFQLPNDLYAYQRDDGDRMAQNGQNWLLCHEMGVGKTPIAIYTAEKLGCKMPLVICPNSLKFEWARQAKEWTGYDSAISRQNTYTRLRDFVYPPNPLVKYRIVNYETLINDDHRALLAQFPWDIIIFDEIHKLRNSKPSQIKKSVKATWDFLNHFPDTKVLGLSGSPIMNYPNDLYVPLSAVAPKRYPRKALDLRMFMNKYTLYAQGRYGSYAYGSMNISQLLEETQDLILRRTKKEVLPFLPDKYYQRPELEMKPDQRKIYEAMENELKILLDTGEPLWSPTVLSTLTRLRQINLDPKIVGVSSSSAKTEFLYDLVESTDEKLIIFSCFERYVYLLSEIFKSWGKKCVTLTGQVPIEKRADAVRMFQETDVPIFLGTIQCAGEGITLTASSTVVLADRWWNEPTNQQAIDRAHRIGQPNKVQVIMPIVIDSVDQTLDTILQRKYDASHAYYEESEVRNNIFSSIRYH